MSFLQAVDFLAPTFHFRMDESSGGFVCRKTGLTTSTPTSGTRAEASLVPMDNNGSFTCTGSSFSTVTDTRLSLGGGDYTVSVILKWATVEFCTALAIRNSTQILNLITVNRISSGDLCTEAWDGSDVNTRPRLGSMNTSAATLVTVTYIAATNTLNLYVNGLLKDSRPQTNVYGSRPPAGASLSLCLGMNYGQVQGFTGGMDEVILWGRALSADEVFLLYLNGWSVGCPFARYWRILFTDTNRGTYLDVSEIEFMGTPSGTDMTGSGTAASDSVYSSGYEASKAFDNNTTTLALTSASLPHWISYDFGVGVAVPVQKYSIRASSNSAIDSPKAWQLQWSTDNVNWTTVHSYGPYSFSTGETWYTTIAYGLANYSALKLVVYPWAATEIDISRLQIFSVSGVADPSMVLSSKNTIAGSALSALTDSDAGTYWRGSPAPFIELDMKFPTGILPGEYEIGVRGDSIVGRPVHWDVIGTTDGMSWYLMSSRRFETWSGGTSLRLALTSTMPSGFIKRGLMSRARGSLSALSAQVPTLRLPIIASQRVIVYSGRGSVTIAITGTSSGPFYLRLFESLTGTVVREKLRVYAGTYTFKDLDPYTRYSYTIVDLGSEGLPMVSKDYVYAQISGGNVLPGPMTQFKTVRGVATKPNGVAVEKVVIRDWDTKQLKKIVVPDYYGAWSTLLAYGMYDITYFSNGCAPLCHGPYTIDASYVP